MITPNMINSLRDTITDLMNLAKIGTLNEYQADKAQVAISSIELMILDEILNKNLERILEEIQVRKERKNEINGST